MGLRCGGKWRERSMLKVYLDTQDFSNLYKKELSAEFFEIKKYLVTLKRKGLVSFPLTYLLLFEFTQDYDAKYEKDRIDRAKLLSDLCGNDTLPYFQDLAIINNPIDYHSWLPFGSADNFAVRRMLSVLRHEIKIRANIPRQLRHDLQNPLVLRNFLQGFLEKQILTGNPSTNWNPELGDFNFDFFRDFLLGKITEDEANTQFRESVFEPAKFFTIWYQRFSNKNALAQFHGETIEKFFKLSQEFHGKLPDLYQKAQASRKLAKDAIANAEKSNAVLLSLGINVGHDTPDLPLVPSFDEIYEMSSLAKFFNAFQPQLRDTMRCYHKALFDRQFHPKLSDFKDIFHSVYIEQVDLWRTDKGFADFLQRTNIHPAEKIVPTLKELPDRIDRLLSKAKPKTT